MNNRPFKANYPLNILLVAAGLALIFGASHQSTFDTYNISVTANSGDSSCFIPTSFEKRYFSAVESFKSYSAADFTPTPSPSIDNPGEELLINSLCDSATPCSPNCCDNEYCEDYHTYNGDRIEPDRVYTVVYGGVIGLNDFETCVAPSENNSCAQAATNQIYLVDESGAARYIHPYGTDEVPMLYGHVSAMKHDANDSLAVKKVYYFGGRLLNSAENYARCAYRSDYMGICSDLFELTLPSVPIS
jgi:hypothetical protein